MILFKFGKINAIIAYINSFLLLFKNFRNKLIFLICYIVSLMFILYSKNKILIILSIIFLIYSIFKIIITMCKIIFGNERLFGIYKKIFDFIRDKEQIDSNEIEKIDNLELLKNDKNILSKLETKIIINRVFLLVSKKYKEYNDSSFYLFQELIIYISVVIISTLTFSLLNYGFYNLDITNFVINGDNHFIDFVLYSIGLIGDDIIPSTVITKILLIIQNFGKLIIFSVFILMFIIKNKEKQKQEIKEIIESFEELVIIEENNIIKTTFFNNIENAIDGLKLIESSYIGFIDLLTRNLKI